MSSKNRKKIGLSDDIPKSTKNDFNIVLKKVQNPKKINTKSPIKRNCPPPNPSPRTPFKTVNIKRDYVNDVIMTVQCPSNKKQLQIKKGTKIKGGPPAVVVAAGRTIDKTDDRRPIIGMRSIKKDAEHSVNVCDKPKSNTSIKVPMVEIEPIVRKPSRKELKQSQGKINFVELTASGNSLHSASSKSTSLYVSSRGEDLRTDRSDSFYDCFESKSSSVLKLFSRKDKHRLWKRDTSLCKLLNEEPVLVEDDSIEEKINAAIPVHKTFSAHMLNNFKKLLHQHSPNNTTKPQDGILSGEDIEVLKKLVDADERYCYLKQEDHQLLKEVLVEQLKQIELQERVFEATLQKLKQSISSSDVANVEPMLPNKEDVNKIEAVPENDDKFNKVVITPLSVNVDLMEALTPDIEEDSNETPLMSTSDMFSMETTPAPTPDAAQKPPIPNPANKEDHINDKKKVTSQSARNPRLSKVVKKDTFSRQQEVEVVFRNIPSRRKEAKILNVISARLEKAYGKGPTPKMCLEDLGVFLNYVSTKVKEREEDVNKKLKEKLTTSKKVIRKKYKIKFQYYALCQRYITRKASVILINECLSSVKEYVVQYLCMDDIKSAGTFYIFQRHNGYNADLEEMDFSKLRNQPELLAKMFKTTKSRETDISIFEYETTLEENVLKGHRGWHRHGDSEYSMKQLMYCLFKTWARYPTLYNPRIQPSDIAQQLADSKSVLHFTRTTTISSTPSTIQDVTIKSQENVIIDNDLKTAEFGSQMKKFLVPTVQITLFAIFVLSFVAFEYRCL